jgi:DNA-binding CsgD family transcriptional regulator
MNQRQPIVDARTRPVDPAPPRQGGDESAIPRTSRPARRITDREREVLALVADGYSTAEIAHALWITEDTVRTHIKRMMVRLDARTRAHVVAIAFREGLWVAPSHANGGGDVR